MPRTRVSLGAGQRGQHLDDVSSKCPAATSRLQDAQFGHRRASLQPGACRSSNSKPQTPPGAANPPPIANQYPEVIIIPAPIKTSGRHEVLVGRRRQHSTMEARTRSLSGPGVNSRRTSGKTRSSTKRRTSSVTQVPKHKLGGVLGSVEPTTNVRAGGLTVPPAVNGSVGHLTVTRVPRMWAAGMDKPPPNVRSGHLTVKPSPNGRAEGFKTTPAPSSRAGSVEDTPISNCRERGMTVTPMSNGRTGHISVTATPDCRTGGMTVRPAPKVKPIGITDTQIPSTRPAVMVAMQASGVRPGGMTVAQPPYVRLGGLIATQVPNANVGGIPATQNSHFRPASVAVTQAQNVRTALTPTGAPRFKAGADSTIHTRFRNLTFNESPSTDRRRKSEVAESPQIGSRVPRNSTGSTGSLTGSAGSQIGSVSSWGEIASSETRYTGLLQPSTPTDISARHGYPFGSTNTPQQKTFSTELIHLTERKYSSAKRDSSDNKYSVERGGSRRVRMGQQSSTDSGNSTQGIHSTVHDGRNHSLVKRVQVCQQSSLLMSQTHHLSPVVICQSRNLIPSTMSHSSQPSPALTSQPCHPSAIRMQFDKALLNGSDDSPDKALREMSGSQIPVFTRTRGKNITSNSSSKMCAPNNANAYESTLQDVGPKIPPQEKDGAFHLDLTDVNSGDEQRSHQSLSESTRKLMERWKSSRTSYQHLKPPTMVTLPDLSEKQLSSPAIVSAPKLPSFRMLKPIAPKFDLKRPDPIKDLAVTSSNHHSPNVQCQSHRLPVKDMVSLWEATTSSAGVGCAKNLEQSMYDKVLETEREKASWCQFQDLVETQDLDRSGEDFYKSFYSTGSENDLDYNADGEEEEEYDDDLPIVLDNHNNKSSNETSGKYFSVRSPFTHNASTGVIFSDKNNNSSPSDKALLFENDPHDDCRVKHEMMGKCKQHIRYHTLYGNDISDERPVKKIDANANLMLVPNTEIRTLRLKLKEIDDQQPYNESHTTSEFRAQVMKVLERLDVGSYKTKSHRKTKHASNESPVSYNSRQQNMDSIYV